MESCASATWGLDNFMSPAGNTIGQLWISKKTGLVLRQEGDVDMGTKGQVDQFRLHEEVARVVKVVVKSGQELLGAHGGGSFAA